MKLDPSHKRALMVISPLFYAKGPHWLGLNIPKRYPERCITESKIANSDVASLLRTPFDCNKPVAFAFCYIQ